MSISDAFSLKLLAFLLHLAKMATILVLPPELLVLYEGFPTRELLLLLDHVFVFLRDHALLQFFHFLLKFYFRA